MRWIPKIGRVVFFGAFLSSGLLWGESEGGSHYSWASFLDEGSLAASTGVAVNYRANRGVADSGIGWGFLDVDYYTGSWHGLTLGTGFLVVPKLWQNHGGDYDAAFEKPYNLRDLYFSWTWHLPEEGHFRVSGGRKDFSGNPSLDGMSQQGAGLSWSAGPDFALHAGAFHRWIKYATPNYDANGITGWEDVSLANEGAGDVFFALTAVWSPQKYVQVSPYINHQDRVMTVYGSTFDYGMLLTVLGHDLVWNTEVILAYYQNRVSSRVEPDYNGVGAGRVYTSIDAARYSTGVGIFWVGKGNQDTKAGLFTIFDPLKEDDLYPFNDRNNTHLFYWMATVDMGQLTIYPAVGIGRNDAVRSNSFEFDLLFDYTIRDNISLSGFYVYVNFERDVLPDYSIVGASLAYGF